MENKKRQAALFWWKSITESNRYSLASEYTGRSPNTLTGREIQIIYEQKRNVLPKVDEELVDFHLIQSFIKILYKNPTIRYDNNAFIVPDKAIENLKRFFNKLSESSSFAHLVHKTLKKQ